jgi:hypothetical protein
MVSFEHWGLSVVAYYAVCGIADTLEVQVASPETDLPIESIAVCAGSGEIPLPTYDEYR